MANFCRNCGKEIGENQNVCSNCGTFVNNPVDDASRKATVGLVLGLVSIVAWILPLAGYPVTICGIVFSAKGLKSEAGKGKATAGLILSIMFLIATLINSFLGAVMYLSYL